MFHSPKIRTRGPPIWNSYVHHRNDTVPDSQTSEKQKNIAVSDCFTHWRPLTVSPTGDHSKGVSKSRNNTSTVCRSTHESLQVERCKMPTERKRRICVFWASAFWRTPQVGDWVIAHRVSTTPPPPPDSPRRSGPRCPRRCPRAGRRLWRPWSGRRAAPRCLRRLTRREDR